ncbi:MAG: carbohydrate ABC transporter permease [Clostridiales bacterium]|nr:carbohydrate ABC transporter permease [Clostridiales bacterium]
MTGLEKRRRRAEGRIMAFLLAAGFLFLLPLVVTFTNSLMAEAEIVLNYGARLTLFDLVEGVTEKFCRISLLPGEISFRQYFEVLLNQPSFLILLANSLKITLPVVAGNLVFSMLTAYGFTIWQWRYKEALFMAYIVVMLMPLQAVLVPNYIVADFLGVRSSYLAIILPGIFSPFGVFLMRQSMKAIPPAYFEAARIDGAGNLQIFFHVVAPQLKSSVAALLMLMFIEYWNLVEQAVIFIDDYTREPLSVYLSRIAAGRIGLVFAASCVYMFLPLWFLLLGQKDAERFYLRELFAANRGHLAKTALAALTILCGLAALMILARQALATCLGWQGLLPPGHSWAVGGFALKLAWLDAWYSPGAAIFILLQLVLAAIFILAWKLSAPKPQETEIGGDHG